MALTKATINRAVQLRRAVLPRESNKTRSGVARPWEGGTSWVITCDLNRDLVSSAQRRGYGSERRP